jgi:hypothetical protein
VAILVGLALKEEPRESSKQLVPIRNRRHQSDNIGCPQSTTRGRPERRVGVPAPNALDQPRWRLRQFVLYGVERGLGAQLILVGGAAADADSADLHLIGGHDW